MKTIVAALRNCNCHYSFMEVMEEAEVDAVVERLKKEDSAAGGIFVGDKFITGLKYLREPEIKDWTEFFRKKLAAAVAESLGAHQ